LLDFAIGITFDDKDAGVAQGCVERQPTLPEKRSTDGQKGVLTSSNPSGARRYNSWHCFAIFVAKLCRYSQFNWAVAHGYTVPKMRLWDDFHI